MPAAPGWVDSHAHVTELADPGAALDRARAAAVTAVVSVGTDLASSQAAVRLADAHAGVAATVGLHPHDAARLDAEWDGLAGLAAAPSVVAVGETGLDLHYRHSPPAAQEASFREHIRLATRLDRALVVHSRDAWDDTFRVLADEGVPARTVLHCFTGGPDEAARALDLGLWLSFSGIVSFRNADDVRAAAAGTPLDRLLVETDAPFLAPAPHRGRPNEPALVPVVGEAVARAAGLTPRVVAEASTAAAAAVFGPLPAL
jgi:TatD DNase family protein